MSIFKACDIRGVVGEDLNASTAYVIGRAVGSMLNGEKCVIGGDVRKSTEMLKGQLSKGLMDAGVDIFDIGIVPTPVFYFAKRFLGAEGGVMVTASHNPSEFNGFKIAFGNQAITKDTILKIKDIAESHNFVSGQGSYSSVNIWPEYRNFFLQSATDIMKGREKPFKIVIDCGSGCWSNAAPELLSEVGFNIQCLFCSANGSFPYRSPNSAIPANLKELCQTVRKTGADLGIAWDGDGDRVSFVDSLGRFLPMDKAIVILARHILERSPGSAVVYDIKSSAIVPESIVAAGGKPVVEKSGHAFIKQRMISDNAAFGGELSGHFFYKELYGGDDGLYSAVMMAAAVGNNLADIADSIPEYVTTPDIRIPLSGAQPKELLSAIKASLPPEIITELDGIRAEYKDGWALIRESVTEPIVTLRFEGKTRESLDKIIEDFLRGVPSLFTAVLESPEYKSLR